MNSDNSYWSSLSIYDSLEWYSFMEVSKLFRLRGTIGHKVWFMNASSILKKKKEKISINLQEKKKEKNFEKCLNHVSYF